MQMDDQKQTFVNNLITFNLNHTFMFIRPIGFIIYAQFSKTWNANVYIIRERWLNSMKLFLSSNFCNFSEILNNLPFCLILWLDDKWAKE